MKKILGLIIALLFVTSAFGVVARQSPSDEREQRVVMGEGDTATIPADGHGRFEKKQEARAERLGELPVKKAKEAYKEAVEKHAQNRNLFLERRQKVLEFKEQIKACRGLQTEECKKLRKDFRAGVKFFLEDSVDMVLSTVEKIESAVEAEGIAPEESLEELKNELTEVKEELQSTEELTEDQIKEKADKIKKTWNELKPKLQKKAQKVVSERIHGVLKIVEKLNLKLKATLEELRSRGVDISTLQGKVDEINSHLEEAKKLHAEGVAMFGENVQKAQDKFKESKKHIKDAVTLLRELVKEVKGKGGDINEETEQAETEGSEEVTEQAEAEENEEGEQ